MSWRALKHFCEGPPEYGLNTPSSDYADGGGIRLLRTSDIDDDGTLSSDAGVFIGGARLETRHQLRAGDLLLSRSGTLGRCLRYETTYGEATFAGYLVRFRPNGASDSRYLQYCSQSGFFHGAIEADAVTSTISNFNAEKYASIRLPWYRLEEQRAIADYLDTETTRIDALITKKRRLIELLEESLTSRVDSWLWKGRTLQLKYVAELLPGYAFPSDDFGPEFDGPPLLRGANVGVGQTSWTDVVRLALPGTGYARYRIQAWDVVVGMDRPFIKAGTRVAVAGELDDGSLLVQRVCRIRPEVPELAPLIAATVRSPRFAAYIESDLTGVSVPHLSEEQLGAFRVPESCLADDGLLARRLESGTARHEVISTRLAKQLDLLVEHRQALITAAVTGGLRVGAAV